MADYNGTMLSPGSVTDFVFTNSNECDSIVTVTVDVLESSSNAISLETCHGTTVDYNGTELSGGAVMDFTFDNYLGCDSVVTVTVLELDQDASMLQLETCIGSTINYNGTNLDPGTETDFYTHQY